MKRLWTAAALAAFFATSVFNVTRADVKLASVFGDGMVIQRDRPVCVWGTADINATVDVTLDGRHASAVADIVGKWSATLPAGPAGGPFTLDVRSGSDSASVRDVLRGDVWLCGGQSNMQMSLGDADGGKTLAADAAEHSTLRLCKVARGGDDDRPKTNAEIKWTTATPDTAEKFSAVGYFFGDGLLKSPLLNSVPVGLIESDLGGTLAEAWAPKEELAAIDPTTIGMSMFGVRPTSLYNGMIAPLGPVGLKGVVWYQGEGNASNPETYPAKLSAVIRGWRKQFDNAELPFLVVQLPDYLPDWGGVYWQWMRDAQREVADTTPHVGLVTAIGTNDGTDLHPKPKRAIGERAALLARQTVYGEAIVGRGPVFEKIEVRGDRVTVTFKTDGSTLTAADRNAVKGFVLAGDDGAYRPAVGTITGDRTVDVRSDGVPTPKTVRYAWAGVPDATLVNKEGLPAYPFRTDTLPVERIKEKK